MISTRPGRDHKTTQSQNLEEPPRPLADTFLETFSFVQSQRIAITRSDKIVAAFSDLKAIENSCGQTDITKFLRAFSRSLPELDVLLTLSDQLNRNDDELTTIHGMSDEQARTVMEKVAVRIAHETSYFSPVREFGLDQALQVGFANAEFQVPVVFECEKTLGKGKKFLRSLRTLLVGPESGRFSIKKREVQIEKPAPSDKEALTTLATKGTLPASVTTLIHELIHEKQDIPNLRERRASVRRPIAFLAIGTGVALSASVASIVAIGGLTGVAVGTLLFIGCQSLNDKLTFSLFKKTWKEYAHQTMFLELQANELSVIGAWNPRRDSIGDSRIEIKAANLLASYLGPRLRELVGGPSADSFRRSRWEVDRLLASEAGKRYATLGEQIRTLRMLGMSTEELAKLIPDLHLDEATGLFPAVVEALNKMRRDLHLTNDEEFELVSRSLRAAFCLKDFLAQSEAKRIACEEIKDGRNSA
ncbi:MAG: hypothetical protein KDD64_12315 [Bdellovibrionales bacterium]|nr:hypothetical protein [Bdellovibrionales bacterium]